jgi:hypothetical protein
MAAFEAETGTGSATSNSYITVAAADGLLDQHPDIKYWGCLTDTTKEVLLRFATRWLDEKFYWYGEILILSPQQALQWPRTKVVDSQGQVIANTGVMPPQLLKATAYVAMEVSKLGGGAGAIADGIDEMSAAVESTGSLKSFQVETLSITFDTGQAGDVSSTARQFVGKRLPEIELILASLGEVKEIDHLAEAKGR